MDGPILCGKRRKLKNDLASGRTTSPEEPLTMTPKKQDGNEMKAFLHEYYYSELDLLGEVVEDSVTAGSKPAVIVDNGKGHVEKLSYKQLDYGANVVKSILESLLESDAQEFVGVRCCVGTLYPVLVLGILRSGHAFFNLDPDNVEASVEDGAKYLRMRYILSSLDWTGTAGTSKLKTVSVLDDNSLSCNLHQVVMTSSTKKHLHTENFAYAIQTSGTTGVRKTVLVPHKCICPNIEAFTKLHWEVTKNDVIFGSAPPTFDPHVVELFSALAGGATIVYTTSNVKISGNLLATLLSSYKITIVQITPTLFRRLSAYISSVSLSLDHLRIVTFGGEKCPEKEELQDIMLHFPNQLFKFQNVYGVTEVSCWASLSDIDLDATQPITIGQGLLETEVWLDGKTEGEIIISSPSRQCVIIDPSANSFQTIPSPNASQYRTGDLGSSTLNGIVFEGRMDRVVKRNGMKVSLYQIEETTLSTGLVSFAECKLHEGKIYLVVALKTDNNLSTKSVLHGKLELPLFMYPDYIISLKKWTIPLNGNGKLDWNSIIKSFHSSMDSSNCIPLSISKPQVYRTLTPIWESCTTPGFHEESIWKGTFIAAGGTSVSATRFIESSFMATSLFGSDVHQKWENILLRCLLDDDKGTFEQFVELFVEIIKNSPKVVETSNLDLDMLPETQDTLPRNVEIECSQAFEVSLINESNECEHISAFNPVDDLPSPCCTKIRSPPEPDKMYKFPLGLCVDASPTIVPFKNQAIIGCHGGVVICVDLDVLANNHGSPSKAIAWTRKFPNRIEATVEIHPNSLFAYVGCHDGNFYKFSVTTGESISWIGIGNPIRSKCAIYNDLVIFIDSDNSIYCVDAHVLNKIWHMKSFKLLATICPVIFRGKCIFVTLDKGIVCLNCSSGSLLWSTSEEFSSGLIYSSPLIIFKERKVQKRIATLLVCATNEGIEARDPKTGTMRWSHKSHLLCTRVHQPLFSTCCNNIVWLENVSSDRTFVSVLKADYGQFLGKVSVSHVGPMTPNLIYSQTNHNKSHEQACYLFFKTSILHKEGNYLPQLRFLSLHEVVALCQTVSDTLQDVDEKVPYILDSSMSVVQWNLEKVADFETFSKPSVCSTYILFGGRDNNLHVVKLKI